MAKSVCIVGAGPAGIIAAKTLLYNHPTDAFKVTVFEQSDRIGGLWPISSTDAGMVNPDMCTNLSRHTVSFSDMAWPEPSPSFPKAWQVGQYLQRYIEKYSSINIQTKSRVIKASRTSDPVSHDTKRWKVVVQKTRSPQSDPGTHGNSTSAVNSSVSDPNGNTSLTEPVGELLETLHFDYLVIASGFFGKPKLPSSLSNPTSFPVPVQHSTQFRTIQELLSGLKEADRRKGGKILVVGGSMSGAEVAASIAMQLSSYTNSPGAQGMDDADNYTVHHVTGRPFWILPLILPVSPLIESDGIQKKYDPSPPFLPLDLVMYNLARRPPGEVKNNSGHINSTAAALTNQYLQSFVGSDQSELGVLRSGGHGHALTMQGGILKEAPWLAISDTYSEFVRSGQITVISGEVVGFGGESSAQSTSVLISSEKEELVLDGIAAVVLATGFEASNSLDFLPDDVLQTLNYDPKCSPLPLVLDIHSTANSEIPDLGFVGFYRGPFWGVMEMQARFLGKLWTGDEKAINALTSQTTTTTELRECYYKNPKELAQFPMGDYVYLMESFRGILGIEIAGEPRTGPVVPARYTSPEMGGEARQQSMQALSVLGMVYDDSLQHRKLVSRAIFRSLQGDWKLQRSLISSIATYPSGTFNGTAKLFPRYADEGYDAQYLYFEEGDFETEQGMKFRANRRYAHRYRESTDTLSVWFIKPDNKTVDYLFHELEILPPKEPGISGWRARAHHLCIDDTYDVEYEFRFRGVGIEDWTLKYGVKGPSKDYRIESVYRR